MTDRETLTIDTAATVNEILAKYPAAVSAFDTFGIDGGRRGNAPLDQAARRNGADPDALIAALDAVLDRARGDR